MQAGYASRQKAISMKFHYGDLFDNCAQCPAPYCPYEKMDEMIDIPFSEDEDDEDELIEAMYDDEDDGW